MRSYISALCLALLLAACGGDTQSTTTQQDAETIVFQNGEIPFGGFAFSSGQPSEARLKELAPRVASIVSFRMRDEVKDFDESAVVVRAGGTHKSIPFAKETLKNPMRRQGAYAAFEEAMKSDKLTWFHCGSGNRVGALWAMYNAEVKKQPLEDSIAEGRKAGLTKLEPLVREILGAK